MIKMDWSVTLTWFGPATGTVQKTGNTPGNFITWVSLFNFGFPCTSDYGSRSVYYSSYLQKNKLGSYLSVNRTVSNILNLKIITIRKVNLDETLKLKSKTIVSF